MLRKAFGGRSADTNYSLIISLKSLKQEENRWIISTVDSQYQAVWMNRSKKFKN